MFYVHDLVSLCYDFTMVEAPQITALNKSLQRRKSFTPFLITFFIAAATIRIFQIGFDFNDK